MPLQDLPHDALLAFDTSTEQLAVALCAGGQRWVDNRAGGAAASAALLPAVQALLERAGRPLSRVAAIAFGRGPGAFTGLRTSCAVAQGLAFGLGRPVLPIDSLLIVAEQARLQGGPAEMPEMPEMPEPPDSLDVGVAMDARMGEIYAARYRWQHGTWLAVQPPGLWSPSDLLAAWAQQAPGVVCGSALSMFDTPSLASRRIDVTEDRASALLNLAQWAHAAGPGLDAAEALPLYLRDKVAQTTAERAAVRAASIPVSAP
jgi:tRNA threonylcarbamoyladenosine biosynthesis protein TsaB